MTPVTKADVRRRVNELRKLLRGTAKLVLEPFEAEEWEASDGSPVALDLANDEVGRGGEPWGEVPAIYARSYAGLFGLAIAGHLNGVGDTMTLQSQSFLASRALARVIIEGSAKGWWLLEPGITTRERVERTYTIRIRALHDVCSLSEAMPGLDVAARKSQAEKLATALKQADALRIKVHKNGTTGEPEGLTRSMPPSASLVDEMFTAEGLDLGIALYSHLSGIVHTQPLALMEYVTNRQPSATDKNVLNVQVGMSLQQVESVTAMSTVAAVAMAHRCREYFGLDTRPIVEWRAHCDNVLR